MRRRRFAILVLGLASIFGCSSEPDSVLNEAREAELEHSQRIMEEYEAKEQ